MPGEVITVRGLKSAIALTTAANAGLKIPQADLLDGTPVEEALTALTTLASCFLQFGAPSVPGMALRAAGRIAGHLEVLESEEGRDGGQ